MEYENLDADMEFFPALHEIAGNAKVVQTELTIQMFELRRRNEQRLAAMKKVGMLYESAINCRK